MKRGFTRFAAMLAACALPTAAQAQCWNEASVTAAKVRDMETMLMVASLRCRAGNPEMLAAYNDFVVQSRAALTQVNDQLRNHFGGLNAYDAYVTSVANRYGGGAAGLTCTDMASILSAARAEGGSFAGLTRLAEAAEVEPWKTEDRCPVVMAALTPAGQ